MRRIQWAWAALLLGMALLAALAQRQAPTAMPLMWLAAAGLLLASPQPAFLGMVAALWGLSLVGINPEVNRMLAVDPVGLLFAAGTVELVALAVVRVILLIMAWNQFLFYRMLYGTAGSRGLDAGLPEIPEVVPNWCDRLALVAIALAGAGLLAVSLGYAFVDSPLARALLTLAAGGASIAIGLGLGVAFSPTSRRAIALAAIGLGSLLFLLAMSLVRSMPL